MWYSLGMNKNLSAKALSAMTDANGSTGRVPTTTSPETLKELRDAGMISTGHGLTRTGRIVRERHVEALMGEAF